MYDIYSDVLLFSHEKTKYCKVVDLFHVNPFTGHNVIIKIYSIFLLIKIFYLN